jgi:hypothetical protein
VEEQATDRTHRIGQKRPVTAIRLIAQGTIDEAVIALHEGKRSLADGLLSGTEVAGKLSSAELIDLIRFGEAALNDQAALSDEAEAANEDEAAIEPARALAPTARKPHGGKRLDLEDLRRLRERFGQQLLHEPITERTVHSYLRAFDRLIDFAGSRSGRRPLAGWLDECIAAIETGQLDAPQSLPQFLRAAVRRAGALEARVS